MPKRPIEETRIVRNQSARANGSVPEAIIIHTTEGGTLDSVCGWFNNPASQASSHIVIGTDGKSAKCVSDDRKAWTCGEFNSLTLNVELCGFASQNNGFWKTQRRKQLEKLAEYIAYWSDKWGIPIDRAKLVHGPDVAQKGVAGHVDVTRAGYGTHTDPGAGFPYNHVLKRAKELSE